MFKSRKCLSQRCILITLKKIIFSLFVAVLFSMNAQAQCTPPIDIPFALVELDQVLIPNPDFVSGNGITFQQPINLNLPLCPFGQLCIGKVPKWLNLLYCYVLWAIHM